MYLKWKIGNSFYGPTKGSKGIVHMQIQADKIIRLLGISQNNFDRWHFRHELTNKEWKHLEHQKIFYYIKPKNQIRIHWRSIITDLGELSGGSIYLTKSKENSEIHLRKDSENPYLIRFFFYPYDTSSNSKKLLELNPHLVQNQPTKKTTIIGERIIRDTKKIIELKNLYNHSCQVCNLPVYAGSSKKFYVEGAHIIPLGKPHNGLDECDNIIILCPNHHVEFDLGAFSINPKDGKTIDHIVGNNNEYHKKK